MVKVKKKQLGELEETLVNEIEAYVEEVNKHKAKGHKISKIELIRSYFKELLANKVLTNDFINLRTSYFYNLEDLRTNSEIIASTEFISEPEHQVKIEQIPNNLDSWSIEFNTYCYNNDPEEHKGINITVLNYPSKDLLEVDYIVYKLKGTELKVGLVKPEFLGILLDKPEEQDLLKELKSIEAEIKEDIKKGLPNSQIAVKYNSRSNFKMLFHEIGTNNIAKLLSRFYIGLLKIEAEYTSKTNRILKEAYSIGVERMPDKVLDEYNNKLDLVYNDYITKRTEFIYSLSNSDITKESEAEIKEKLKGFIKEMVIEEASSDVISDVIEDLFSVAEEDVDLKTKAIKFENLTNNFLDSMATNGLNMIELINNYILTSSEDSENMKTLINIFSKYSVEEYSENPEVMNKLIKELESSFNIDFGLETIEDS